MLHHVAKWGVELEGAWDNRPPDYEECYHDDCSVSARGRFTSGEMVTPPMSAWGPTKDFMRRNYPDHVGASCGMHIHMSFRENTLAISAILDSREYQDKLLAELEKFGRKHRIRAEYFWQRVQGRNEYCRLDWAPENIISNRERYRVVNFTAYHRHKTIEIRVLPMFRNQTLARAAVRKVLAFTDLYLRKAIADGLGTDDEPIVCVLPMPEDETADEPVTVDVNLPGEPMAEPEPEREPLFRGGGTVPIDVETVSIRMDEIAGRWAESMASMRQFAGRMESDWEPL